MRLDLDPTSSAASPARGFRLEPAGSRLGLWGPLYLALWANAAVLAVVALWPRQPAMMWLQVGCWAAAQAVAAALAGYLRIEFHDLLIGLSERDRFLLGLFVMLPIVLPASVKGPRMAPDGFLWATPTMLLLCVTPALARRFLFLTLLGAWLASMKMTGEPALGLLIGFGLSWLIALGAVHFAWTGEPHGLGGWWPVRKVLFNAIAAAIPAALAAILLWMAWPGPRPPKVNPVSRLPEPPQPAHLIKDLDPLEMQKLILHGAVMVLATLFLIVVMHYLRRFLLRRGAHGMAMKLIPGQVAQVEFHDEPPPAKKLKLPGMRGRIVQLWGRWATALEQGGKGRQPGETAETYARRLAAEAPSMAPPPEMTLLLERVHYGQDEPKKEDYAAMQRHVQAQIAEIKRLAADRSPHD